MGGEDRGGRKSTTGGVSEWTCLRLVFRTERDWALGPGSSSPDEGNGAGGVGGEGVLGRRCELQGWSGMRGLSCQH